VPIGALGLAVVKRLVLGCWRRSGRNATDPPGKITSLSAFFKHFTCPADTYSELLEHRLVILSNSTN